MPRVQTPRDVAHGTQPLGTADEASASRYVRELFSNVAGRYDLLNHLLSLNVDRYWRWAVARHFRSILRTPSARVMDLCCGTGDLSLALSRRGKALIIGSDFSHNMLTRARQKFGRSGRQSESRIPVAEADALQMPFADSSFDLLTCAFGFRNLANYNAGLEEILRLLRPGGEVGILEFSEPVGVLAPFYSVYFHHILPKIGEWITGVPGAYRYLTRSVDRFPPGDQFSEWMKRAGFRKVRVRKLTGGIAMLYIGQKAP